MLHVPDARPAHELLESALSTHSGEHEGHGHRATTDRTQRSSPAGDSSSVHRTSGRLRPGRLSLHRGLHPARGAPSRSRSRARRSVASLSLSSMRNVRVSARHTTFPESDPASPHRPTHVREEHPLRAWGEQALSEEASNYVRLAFKSPAITDACPIVTIPVVAHSFFLFRPQPTHHATARCMAMCSATSPAAHDHLGGVTRSVRKFRLRVRTLYVRWSGRPRRVTVFAERLEQTGAAHPQKQRRASTPALVVRFVRSFTFASPAHARSRRLQRASVAVPHVLLGQTSRPRPGEPQRNDITFAAAARPRELVAAAP